LGFFLFVGVSKQTVLLASGIEKHSDAVGE
jgi:hypothetical protein